MESTISKNNISGSADQPVKEAAALEDQILDMEVNSGELVRFYCGLGCMATYIVVDPPTITFYKNVDNFIVAIIIIMTITLTCVMQIDEPLSKLAITAEEEAIIVEDDDDEIGLRGSSRAPGAPVESRKRRNKCGSLKRKQRALKKLRDEGGAAIGGQTISSTIVGRAPTSAANGLRNGSQVPPGVTSRSVTFPSPKPGTPKRSFKNNNEFPKFDKSFSLVSSQSTYG